MSYLNSDGSPSLVGGREEHRQEVVLGQARNTLKATFWCMDQQGRVGGGEVVLNVGRV